MTPLIKYFSINLPLDDRDATFKYQLHRLTVLRRKWEKLIRRYSALPGYQVTFAGYMKAVRVEYHMDKDPDDPRGKEGWDHACGFDEHERLNAIYPTTHWNEIKWRKWFKLEIRKLT